MLFPAFWRDSGISAIELAAALQFVCIAIKLVGRKFASGALVVDSEGALQALIRSDSTAPMRFALVAAFRGVAGDGSVYWLFGRASDVGDFPDNPPRDSGLSGRLTTAQSWRRSPRLVQKI